MAVRYRQCQTAQFSQYAWKCWEAQRIDIYTTVTRIASCQYSWPLSSLHRLLSQFITDWIGVFMRTTITQLLQVLSPCLFNGEDCSSVSWTNFADGIYANFSIFAHFHFRPFPRNYFPFTFPYPNYTLSIPILMGFHRKMGKGNSHSRWTPLIRMRIHVGVMLTSLHLSIHLVTELVNWWLIETWNFAATQNWKRPQLYTYIHTYIYKHFMCSKTAVPIIETLRQLL